MCSSQGGQLLPALLLRRPGRIGPRDPGRGGIDPDRAPPPRAPVGGLQLGLHHQYIPAGEIRARTVTAPRRPGSQVAVAVAVAVPVTNHLHLPIGIQRPPPRPHRGIHPARMRQAELGVAVRLDHHPGPLRRAIQDLNPWHPRMVLRPSWSSRQPQRLQHIPGTRHTEELFQERSTAGCRLRWAVLRVESAWKSASRVQPYGSGLVTLGATSIPSDREGARRMYG
jgi:hypothetical protein